MSVLYAKGKERNSVQESLKSKYQKTSEMCSPVKGSASNDNTAVVQKQINPARMKNQWALRNSDNEKVSLPVRSSGEAPLTEQPSAFSCLLCSTQPFTLLSPSSSELSKSAQNLGKKRQQKVILGDTEGRQKNQPLKANQPKANTVFGNQRNHSLLHTLSPVPGKPMHLRGPEPDVYPMEEAPYSHAETKRLCTFFCQSDTAVGKKFKEANVKQPWFPWMLSRKLWDDRKICIIDKRLSWLSPLLTHHVSVFLGRLNVCNIKAEIHTAEEEILQETPHKKAAADNTSSKERGSKNCALLKRKLAPIHSLKVTFVTKSKATRGLSLGSVLSADGWNLAVRKETFWFHSW